MFKILQVAVTILGIFISSCNSFPIESHEVLEDSEDTTEIDAEYICSSDRSISELKSLASSNNSCDGKDLDFEYWLASCHCTINSSLPCPSCLENYDMYQQGRMVPLLPEPQQLVAHPVSTTTTAKAHSIRTHPTSTSTTTTTTTHAPVQRTSSRPTQGEVDTHAKLVIRNSTPNSINFIRFG